MRRFVILPALSAAMAGLALTAMLTGCGGKTPRTRYYTIEAGLPAAPQARAQTFLFDVSVARFRAANVLQQDRLLYRTGPVQLDYYEYHRWSDPPPDLLTEALVSHLRRAGLFRSVTTLSSGAKPDYILRGHIDNLEEVDSGDQVTVRVSLSLDLVDGKTRGALWSGKGNYEGSVPERSVDAVVAEINKGVHQGLEQLTRGLASYFQSLPAAAR